MIGLRFDSLLDSSVWIFHRFIWSMTYILKYMLQNVDDRDILLLVPDG
jgi:hypothetical protein